jgi:hypothetical protein
VLAAGALDLAGTGSSSPTLAAGVLDPAGAGSSAVGSPSHVQLA